MSHSLSISFKWSLIAISDVRLDDSNFHMLGKLKTFLSLKYSVSSNSVYVFNPLSLLKFVIEPSLHALLKAHVLPALYGTERYMTEPCFLFVRSVTHCHICKSYNHESICSMLLGTAGFNNFFDVICCLYSSATNV